MKAWNGNEAGSFFFLVRGLGLRATLTASVKALWGCPR